MEAVWVICAAHHICIHLTFEAFVSTQSICTIVRIHSDNQQDCLLQGVMLEQTLLAIQIQEWVLLLLLNL